MSDEAKVSGHCLCGAVKYSTGDDPMSTVICHCEDCRRSSGAAFSVNVIVADENLTLEGETLSSWETTGTETGEKRQRKFCSRCGSQVATMLAEMEGLAVIKAGTLDDPSWVAPEMEIWCDSAHPWIGADRDERGQFPTGLPT